MSLTKSFRKALFLAEIGVISREDLPPQPAVDMMKQYYLVLCGSARTDKNCLNSLCTSTLVTAMSTARSFELDPVAMVKKLEAVLQAKGEDYTGGRGRWFNFEFTAEALGISVETSILVRIGDKVSRLMSLADGKDPSVAGEKVEDTIMDLIGYLILLDGYVNAEHNVE